MKNPWMKKNPLLSMWLSAANAAVGTARGTADVTMRRAAKQLTSAWTDAFLPPKPRRRRRK